MSFFERTHTIPASSREEKLALTEWRSEGENRDRILRALLIVHGMGEHGLRYRHFPEFLKSDLARIFALDMRGHGRSEGGRGHIENFDELVDDVRVAIFRVRELVADAPMGCELHLLGHSMGGLIALLAIIKYADLPIQSVTLSAPLLKLKMSVPVVKRVGAVLLNKILPALSLPTGLDVNGISHDPKIIDAYQKDRLVHARMTPRFFSEYESQQGKAWNARGFQCPYPTALILPGADPIVDSAATKAWFEEMRAPRREIFEYPTFFHESFNELGKERVFEDLKKWILLNPKTYAD